MNICEHCDGLHLTGFHTRHCPDRGRVTITPIPEPTEYRIEWFGSLQVHQPVKP